MGIKGRRITAITLVVLTWAAMGLGGLHGCRTDQGAMSSGRVYMGWFYEGEYARLWDAASDILKDTFGSREIFAQACSATMEELDQEERVVAERVLTINSFRLYLRKAEFTGVEIPVSVELGMDAGLHLMYLDIRPLPEEAASRFLSYTTKTSLRLPFEGTWTVIWGGRTTWDNYHADCMDQRFASDFMVFENGFIHSGDGSVNENYYCFGRSICAPGDGVVVASESNVPDNAPGSEDNLDAPLGNHVIIDHENGEYSFLCHFRQGTVTVAPGQRVTKGQVLGLCGNSGASDLPHLHYHVQNTPVPYLGEGLPAQFRTYQANGGPVEMGEPVRGQQVQAWHLLD